MLSAPGPIDDVATMIWRRRFALAKPIAAHSKAALAGVFDVHAPAADEVATRLGVQKFPSAEAVLVSPAVDAVLIATSTPTHADFVEQAVAAGKPVLCEKPIDLSFARV